MSDRLKTLKHQKQLMEEHLQWLEQEIASESEHADSINEETEQKSEPKVYSAPVTNPQPEEIPAVAAIQSEEEDLEQITDQLISQYAHQSVRREMDPRLALFLYFGGALGFLALVVFLFYWFGYR